MGHGLQRSLYLRVRRFVDRDIAKKANPATPFLGALPLVGMGLIQQYLDGPALIAGWALVIILGLAWTAFTWWRGYRLFVVEMIRGDRAFDQRGKFLLSPEYWASESVLRARRRRRRER